MTPSTLTDAPVERDAEGFFVDPEQWTEEMAMRSRARTESTSSPIATGR